MKLIDSRLISGRSLGLFVSLALAAGAYAGPGPQLRQQTRPQAPAVAQAPSAPAAVAPAMACPLCQNRVISEFHATNAGGKWAPHSVAVGVEHDCANCRGAITAVAGQTVDRMAKDCAICARAMPACCSTNG